MSTSNIAEKVYVILKLESLREQYEYEKVVTRAIQSLLAEKEEEEARNTLLQFVTLLSPPTFDFEIDKDNVTMRIYQLDMMESNISELTNISRSSSSNLTILSLFRALGYNNVSIAFGETQSHSETDYSKVDVSTALMNDEDTKIRLNNLLPKKGWTPQIKLFEYVYDKRIMKLIKKFCELQGIHYVEPVHGGGKKKKKTIKKKLKYRKYIYRKRKRSTRKR